MQFLICLVACWIVTTCDRNTLSRYVLVSQEMHRQVMLQFIPPAAKNDTFYLSLLTGSEGIEPVLRDLNRLVFLELPVGDEGIN